ncbi:MAG TPA: amidohydrolase [Steroidobacteraceae bacterium]|jgi:predicted amidohydrolase
MSLRVTLVQQSIVWHDAAANRAHLDALLAPLEKHTDLIVLPEMFTTGFSMDVEPLAEPVNGPTSQWLRAKAQELNAAITGSLITKDGEHYYNRLLWAAPGHEVRHYDKRHLFRMANEHHHFTPGGAPLALEWRGLRICPLVCYDLRFPVYSRRRPELEYDLLLYVASWPAARRKAWQALLRARAIENLAYVVGVNRIGRDGNGIVYSGDSVAHDFFGEVIAELDGESAVATVELDAEALKAFRQRFPAHLDADRFTLAP